MKGYYLPYRVTSLLYGGRNNKQSANLSSLDCMSRVETHSHVLYSLTAFAWLNVKVTLLISGKCYGYMGSIVDLLKLRTDVKVVF
ncbi:hypothetical protein LINGRAHAP2_LOCUS32891, partial [Linum grandiflorum]